MYGVLPRHERAPARAADGVDVVVVEDEARVGQRVDVGGGDLVRAVETHIVPALQQWSGSKAGCILYTTQASPSHPPR